MAKKYDIESLLNDLVAIAKANLGPQLALINAEKSDSITLLTPDSNAYFFQSLDKSTAASYPLFVFYGIDDPAVEALGPHTAQTVEVFFIVVLMDTAENAAYMTRLLRYSRALKEIFEANYARIPKAARLLVSSVAPVSFALENTPGTFKAVGVKVKAVIA